MTLADEAQIVADRLQQTRIRVVFAESCTAGLVAATMATVPGISEWLCGSAVTYREATKQQWLHVAPSDLQEFSAVSQPVARQMATAVLQQTPEADFAVSVTGHLGPDAPPNMDGVVYIGRARRSKVGSIECDVTRHELQRQERTARQEEATELVLQCLANALNTD